MTDTDTTVLDRLDQIVARLEALGLAVPAVPRAALDPDGTPGHVAAGELIESAWGNAVVDQLDDHERLKVDTGWTALTIVSGITGNLSYRRVGSSCTLLIACTRNGANLGDVTVNLGTIAEVAGRPTATIPGVARIGNPVGTCRINVAAGTGLISLLNLSVNDTGIIWGSVSWLVALPA